MNKALLFGAGLLVGAAAGLYAGYEVAKRKLYDEFNERMNEEIEGMRVFYEKRKKAVTEKEFANPEEAVKALISQEATAEVLETVVEKLQYQTLKDRASPVPVLNVFAPKATAVDDEQDNDAWEREVAKRDPAHPYVISDEEFLKSDNDYRQVTLTWYAGDRVLADEADEVIQRVERTVGVDNMKRFGYKSNDVNVVYIRNDKYHTEYQVLLHSQKFKVHVLGLEDEAGR